MAETHYCTAAILSFTGVVQWVEIAASMCLKEMLTEREGEYERGRYGVGVGK